MTRTVAPSRVAQIPFRPHTIQIEDVYGEIIVLAQRATVGDIGAIEVSEYDVDGRKTGIKIVGKFHNDWKENMVDSLARLAGMKKKSEQENESLLFIAGYPMLQLRGFVKNLVGPSVETSTHGILYSWSFDFIRQQEERQPIAFNGPSGVVAAEGKPYTLLTIPNAALTDLKELAYVYYGKRYTDGRLIAKIIRLNNLTFPQTRALTPGSVLKMPILR